MVDMEKSQVAETVRSPLRYEKSHKTRQAWWVALAGLLTIAVVYSFGQASTTLTPVFGFQSDVLLRTVLNETLGFQKIFVISSKSQADHRDRMTLAASVSGIKVEFLDAVTVDQISPSLLSDGPEGLNMSSAGVEDYASWRSHVNAIQAVVDQNLGSALILEDDADWDVRLKTQLRDWALTTRQLVQPTRGDPFKYLDRSHSRASHNLPIAAHLESTQWEHDSPIRAYVEPETSAYGDLTNWDVLWAGHCGQRFARPDSECPKTPLGRVVMHDDPTAAQTQHFSNLQSGDEYKDSYANHSRVTSWSCAQACNTAYALSNQGAKKLLYDSGVRLPAGAADAMLRDICDGEPPFERRTCVSVTPPLIGKYVPKEDCTPNIRLSTKQNLRKLVNGATDLVDRWPDNEPTRPC